MAPALRADAPHPASTLRTGAVALASGALLFLGVALSGCAAAPSRPCARPAASPSAPPPAEARAAAPRWGLRGDGRLSYEGLHVWKPGNDAFGNDDPGGTELVLRFVDPKRQIVGVDKSQFRLDHWTAIGKTSDFSAKARVSSDAARGGHTLDIHIHSPKRPAAGALGFDVAGTIGVRYVASERNVEVVLDKGDASPHPVEGGITLSRKDGPSASLKLPSATIVHIENLAESIGELRFYNAAGAEIEPAGTAKSFSWKSGSQNETRDAVFNETPSPISVVVPIRRFATEKVAFTGVVGLGL